jgi:hypothetical protein
MPSSNPVVPGDYDIYNEGKSFSSIILIMFLQLIYPGPIQISDEAWFSRLISYATSGREDGFRNGVRARDEKCVMSGKINDGLRGTSGLGLKPHMCSHYSMKACGPNTITVVGLQTWTAEVPE